MKKLIITIISVLSLSILNANAQLVVVHDTSSEENGQKDLVSLVMNKLVVRQLMDDKSIYLCCETSNRYEDSYATIYLGKDIDSALETLNDLLNLPVDSKRIITTVGMNNKTTVLRKVNPLGSKGIRFETEDVAGEADIADLWIKRVIKELIKVK